METWRELLSSGRTLPDDRELPWNDGKFAKSAAEAPLRQLLTATLRRWFDGARRLDIPYLISGNTGVYWRLPEPPEPLIRGAVDPDWYCVLGRPQQLVPERCRNSYVMWQDGVVPVMAIEFVLPEDVEARDRTPGTGKFWIYEQGLGVPYYGIYGMEDGTLEVFQLINDQYEPLLANVRGHHEIPPLEVELGVWLGCFQDLNYRWLRWWNMQGKLLQTAEEWWTERKQARDAQEKVEQELAQIQSKNERLEAKLRALGIDPDQP